jgi:aryl carrier-like protein
MPSVRKPNFAQTLRATRQALSDPAGSNAALANVDRLLDLGLSNFNVVLNVERWRAQNDVTENSEIIENNAIDALDHLYSLRTDEETPADRLIGGAGLADQLILADQLMAAKVALGHRTGPDAGIVALDRLRASGLTERTLVIHVERWRAQNDVTARSTTFETNALEALDHLALSTA